MKSSCVFFVCVFLTFLMEATNSHNSTTLSGEGCRSELDSLSNLIEKENFDLAAKFSDSLLIVFLDTSLVCYQRIKLKQAEVFLQTKRLDEAQKQIGKSKLWYFSQGDTLSEDYLKIIEFQAFFASGERNFPVAEKHYLETIKLSEVIFADRPIRKALFIKECGNFYYKYGKYKQAREKLLVAKKLYEACEDTEENKYNLTIYELGKCCKHLGLFEEGENYLKEGLKRIEAQEGRSSIYYYVSEALAELYVGLGNYSLAEKLFLESKAFVEEDEGEYSSRNGATLNNLALLYNFKGDQNKAELYYNECLKVVEVLVGKEHPHYAITIQNLGALYLSLNNLEKAEECFLESERIKKKIHGEEHPSYGLVQSWLAQAKLRQKAYDQALVHATKARQINLNSLGKEHYEVGHSDMFIGEIFLEQGEFEKAKNAFENAHACLKKINKGHNINYPTVLKYQARLFNNQGLYDKAKVYLEDAIKIFRELFGEESSIQFAAKWDLVRTYISAQDLTSALNELQELVPLEMKNSNEKFGFLAESEREKIISGEKGMDLVYALAKNQVGQKANDLGWQVSQFRKGRMLRSSITSHQLKMESEDTLLTQSFEQLKIYKNLLAKCYETPISRRKPTDTYENIVDSLEKQIVRRYSDYADLANAKLPSFEDIKTNLVSGDVIVDFVSYRDFKVEYSDTVNYAALLYDFDSDSLAFVSLFNESELIDLNTSHERKSAYVAHLYNSNDRGATVKTDSKSLYESIWLPLENHLQGKKRIFYSSTGSLNRLNLQAIAVSKRECMADRFEMYNLMSFSSMFDDDNLTSNKDAYVVGGVEYNTVDEVAMVGSTLEADNLFASLDRSFNKEGWSFLEWTVDETESVSSMLKSKTYQVNYLTGAHASEASFKQLGSKEVSPAIIHLATHGFFFPDSEQEDDLVFKEADNPMLRSGLIMAGGNNTWKGERDKGQSEDGILTAYEISLMNLSNTELVVLSACDTGLGDIKGHEGVYGLQRAFKKAGVKYMIMSLWQIPDRESATFMMQFYKNWIENEMPIKAAFNKTQLEMKERFFDPYQWAGFILLE